jgi:hypothetical protein
MLITETTQLFYKTFKYLAIFIFALISSCSPFGEYSEIQVNSPELNWDNSSYDFGNLVVGSNATQTFTIVNQGLIAAEKCEAVTLSDSVNFTVLDNTCTATTMIPGESCNLTVQANPIVSGPKTLLIQRKCSDQYSDQMPTINLTVNAIFPILTWSPLNNDFGTFEINQSSSAQTFTLTNNGDARATNCGLVSMANVTDFSITSDTCGVLDLDIGQSCSVSVVGVPSGSGLFTNTLYRSCDYTGAISTNPDQITVTGNLPMFNGVRATSTLVI